MDKLDKEVCGLKQIAIELGLKGAVNTYENNFSMAKIDNLRSTVPHNITCLLYKAMRMILYLVQLVKLV